MSFEVATRQIKKDKDAILSELRSSLQQNNAIGIFIKDSHELVTTAVIDILKSQDNDYIIKLMDQDLHGYPIERNQLLLSNINSVIHFNIPFNDPLYVKVRRKETFRI